MAIHDLTFSDWDNYTDGDGTAFTLDWTDVAAMTRQFPYPYVEAIRQALVARFNVSRRNAFVGVLVPISLNDPVLSTAWVNEVLQKAIQYLRGWSSFFAASSDTPFDWIRPGKILTLDNVPEPYTDLLTNDTIYIGSSNRANYYAMSDGWTHGQTNMLDDAGIVDTAFRTWWLTPNSWGGYMGIENNLLFPFATVLLNVKKMLSLLVNCIDARIFFQSGVGGTTRLTINGSDIREYSTPIEGGEAGWYAAKDAFDLVPWSTTPPTNPRHKVSFIGPWTGAGYIFTRVRTDVDIDLGGTETRDVEISINLPFLYWETWWYLGQTYLQPWDYPGVDPTQLPFHASTDPMPPPRWVYGAARTESGHVGPTLSHVFGDFGDSTLRYEGGKRNGGWNTYSLLILEDFNVTDGFTFR